MLKLFDDLLAENELMIGGKEILLTIPQHNVKSNSADPFKSRRESKFDSLVSEHNTFIEKDV